jgi:hypothetical protein
MSAKARFLKKLQEQHPRSVAFDTKAEADIATFRQRISQLQESMETWLNGTEIRTEATTTMPSAPARWACWLSSRVSRALVPPVRSNISRWLAKAVIEFGGPLAVQAIFSVKLRQIGIAVGHVKRLVKTGFTIDIDRLFGIEIEDGSPVERGFIVAM